MKKISLVLCFALLLVAMLAFSAFAATSENVVKDATLAEDGGCGSASLEMIRDGDVNTAASCGSAASWVNFHFKYADGINVSKVVVVVNSTGNVYYDSEGVATSVKEYTELSTLPNIYCRLYVGDTIVYKLENVATNNATTYTFDLGGVVYSDITKVEVATVHGGTNDMGIWEVEIYDYNCVEEADHNYSDATCTTKATCAYCGVTKGEVSAEHAWIDATCAAPKTCSVCGTTEGEPDASLHIWKNASYTAPATCKVCGATTGDVWVDSTLPNFVRGDEGDKITYEDLVGEIILNSGTTTFGDVTGALDGNYSTWWGGCSGPNNAGGCDQHTESASIKIVFKNEWEITGAKMVAAGNWVSYKIEFFAADGTLLGQFSKGGFQMNTGFCGNQNDATNADREDLYTAIKNISYGDKDKAVKYVIFTNTSSKWHSLPQIAEFEFTGRERIPTACENHEFEEQVVLAPTCTEPGSKQNVCTICGVAEGLVTIPALDHTYDEYRIKTPATCTTAAIIEFECSRCGVTIERPTHINDVTDFADLNGVATNGAGGWTTSAKALFDNNMDSYLHASGQWFVESALELDMAYYLTSVTVWTGSWGDNNSWEAYFTFYYQAPGSDEWVQYETTKAAGVIKAGEKYKHTLELAEPVYADAIKIRVDRLCSFQGQAWEAEVAAVLLPETAPLGHTWEVTKVVDAACDAGYTLSTCTVCGETKTDAYTKAVGHIWADATCTTPKTCTVCAVTEGDALGHSYFYPCDVVCQVCYEESNPDATHNIVHVDAVAATCTSNGNVEYWYCSDCGSAWLDEARTQVTNQMSVIIAAAGHSYSVGYVEWPTCVATGLGYYECDVCGDTIGSYDEPVEIPATGEHSYPYYPDSTTATCTEGGVATYTCYECNAYTITEEVGPTGHDFGWSGEPTEVITAATCTDDGLGLFFCYNCQQNIEDVIPATGHNMVKGEINLETHTCVTTCENGCGTTEVVSTLGWEEDPIAITVPGSFVASVTGNWTYYTFTQSGEGYITFTFDTDNVNVMVKEINDLYATQYFWGGNTTWTAEIMGDGKYVIAISTADNSPADIATTTEYKAEDVPDLGEVSSKPIIIENVNTGYTSTGKVWYKFETPCAGTVTINVEGEATVSYGVDPEALTTYTAPFVDENGYTTYYILVESEAEVSFILNVEAPVGSMDNPFEIVVGNNAVTANPSWPPFYAAFESNVNGTLTINYDAATYANVQIYCGTHPYMMQTPVTDGTIIEVSAYTTYYFGIQANDEVATDFTIVAGFEEAEAEMPEPDGDIGEIIGSMVVETTETYGFEDEYIYVAEKAGKYTFAVPVGLGFYSKAQSDAWGDAEIGFYDAIGGYVTVELAAGEEYTFYVGSLEKSEWTLDVYFLAPAHTHTEVEIPAVLPTPSVVGMTAGVQCSECGEVIVAPQEVTVTDVVKGNGFEFKAISLLLGKNISIDYKAQVPAGYTNVYAVFEFADFPESVVSEFTIEGGRYVFNFSGTRIHMMNDNIAAYLYGVNANGEYERFVYSTYSVVTYCANQLKKTDTITAKLKTALSDLLVLGAETQKFVNKNIKDADLVTTIIKNMGYTLTPSTFTSIPDACNKQEVTGTKVETTDWRSASLLLGEQTKIQLKFISNDIENVTVKIFVPNVVNANVIDEYEFTTEDFEYEASSGRYVVTFDQLTAIQYDTQITAKLYANGEEIGRTFKYSINTYLYKNYGTLDIAKALYLYGESIKAYAGK